MIRDATSADRDWIVKLFTLNKGVLGNVASSVWYRYWQADQAARAKGALSAERWIVAVDPETDPETQRGMGFFHYRLRRDGWRSGYELATHPDFKRRGVATSLLRHAGAPITLKTDADHPESNGLYKALGFSLMAVTPGKHGTKTCNIYQLWELP
jgi:ribosomal protein S18 acetylase RimI-like enzyme